MRRARLRQQVDDALASLRAHVAFPALIIPTPGPTPIPTPVPTPTPIQPTVLVAKQVRASAGGSRHYAMLVDEGSGRILYRSTTQHAEAEAVRLASTHARRSGLSIANLGEIVGSLEHRA